MVGIDKSSHPAAAQNRLSSSESQVLTQLGTPVAGHRVVSGLIPSMHNRLDRGAAGLGYRITSTCRTVHDLGGHSIYLRKKFKTSSNSQKSLEMLA